MPLKKGSCLSEEYTEMLKQLQRHMKEAKKIYDQLPECIAGRMNQIDSYTTIQSCLVSGSLLVNTVLLDFGIQEDDNGR